MTRLLSGENPERSIVKGVKVLRAYIRLILKRILKIFNVVKNNNSGGFQLAYISKA
jgi:hypothetical protein